MPVVDKRWFAPTALEVLPATLCRAAALEADDTTLPKYCKTSQREHLHRVKRCTEPTLAYLDHQLRFAGNHGCLFHFRSYV